MSGLRVSRAAIFWAILQGMMRFNSKSSRTAVRFLSRRDEKSVTPKIGPKMIRFPIHLARYDAFSGRTFGPKTHVTIVT